MDRGKEYSPNRLAKLAKDLGQVVELTILYNLEQDGTSERSIGILCERTRTAMIDLSIPMILWPLILEAMVLITNRTATSTLNGKTPYEALTDELHPGQDNRPSVAHFRVLGCKTYVQIPKERRVTSEKVKERAEVGILVGYEGTHIFKVYVPSRRGPLENRIVRSSNVRFDEGGLISKNLPIENDDFPIPAINRGENQDRETSVPDLRVSDKYENLNQQGEETELSDLPNHPEVSSDIETDNEEKSDEDDIESLPEISTLEATTQRSRGRPKGAKNKIHKPDATLNRQTRSQQQSSQKNSVPLPPPIAFYNAYAAGSELIYDDPKTVAEAKTREDWPEWKKAIEKEYRGITHKRTWKLLKRSKVPKEHKVLHGRLVLRTKRDQDSKIIKRKARWVVKGFEQQYRKDYEQTFASVCKSATWKLAIALAALFGLEIEQMDAVGAFLNSEADSDIYVEMPPEWKDEEGNMPDSQKWVCKLLKALYGLKQAPRLWQKKLAKALAKLGFKPCLSD
jgi:hypothetical protein